MGKNKLRSKDLDKISYTNNKARSLAIDIMTKHFKHHSKEEKLEMLVNIKSEPEKFKNDEKLKLLALALMPNAPAKELGFQNFELLDPKDFRIYGSKNISQNAIQQMKVAMQLPIVSQGALMPDAHQGYGLPIGGVIATKNAVIPYGVGVDIGCRMSLSLFDADEKFLKRNHYAFEQALKNKTSFGTGGELDIKQDHSIFERDTFNDTPLLQKLKGKAIKQLGSSGSGNHFVEFGMVSLEEDNNLNLPKRDYLALLSHSGSRGFGASIAQHYSLLARKVCKLPNPAGHLAWLDMDSENGQEYWLSMNLAGDYAKACHDQIHLNLSQALGLKAICNIENHHNFAWKEIVNEEELIVHRKGATPAAKGEWGIIPGSMAAPGFIVSGKGIPEALSSASHGAGRNFSRKKARESFTMSGIKKQLKEKGISLIGAGTDEAPGAYKDIEEVMRYQRDLVKIEGRFWPKVVRMDKN